MAKRAKVTVSDRTPMRAAIANRLKHPFGRSTTAIPLKEPKRWELRIVDAHMRNDRLSEVKDKGWDFVEPEDVACDVQDYGFRQDGRRIVRGDRGSEVLMKMEREEWRLVQRAKTEANIRQTHGVKEQKKTILERSSAEQGDQATTFLDKALSHMEVRDSLEPADEPS